jgi:DNA-binding response OmpR family regulator
MAPNWDFIVNAVKRALRKLDLGRYCCLRPGWGETSSMPQPRLLLIDDEPALAEFLANAAKAGGFEPIITARDDEFREQFVANRPEMVALDLGMPGMDGVELIRFLADQDYRGPVLIVSGFDRRVLESAFRLGEALGLSMAGPVEKPVRLEVLEELLARLKQALVM